MASKKKKAKSPSPRTILRRLLEVLEIQRKECEAEAAQLEAEAEEIRDIIFLGQQAIREKKTSTRTLNSLIKRAKEWI